MKAFQFPDIRPKAASEMASLDDASSLLGHTDKQITKRVYRRAGESVKSTK
jgi:integrase